MTTDNNTNPTKHDAFEQELRSSAADVLKRCDTDIAPGVVRAIRERSITSSIDESAHPPILAWFGWREMVGIAAVLALAGAVWWSGFESGRAAKEAEAAQARALMRAIPEVGDQTASSLRGALARVDDPMTKQATELSNFSRQFARSIVDGLPVPGLWDRLTNSPAESPTENPPLTQ